MLEGFMDNSQRDRKIAALKKKGFSYNYIARKYKLSRERIKQICHQHNVGGPARIVILKGKIAEQKTLF